MINMNAVELAAVLARKFEGCYLSPYLCPAGIPTIGYGATFYEDGTAVTLKDLRITKARAESLLLWQLAKVFLVGVKRLCPEVTTAERPAVLIDFSFNLGLGRLKSSTLRKEVNKGNWAAVPTELRKWNKGGGKRLRGLTLRREAECLLLG